MDCPNCNTWNPEDKEVCWRCQTPLPKPKPPKKRSQFGGFSNWVWLLIVVFFCDDAAGPVLLLSPGHSTVSSR